MGTQKAAKAEVHYRTGEFGRRCGLCTMFVRPLAVARPASCTAVEGKIEAGKLCDLFERRGGASR